MASENGEFIVVLDDLSRENEGDLIIAAEDMTTEKMAFMVRYTSGYLCVPLSGEVCDRLGLLPMYAVNQDKHGTAYTVTVDAKKGVGTGISASDRAKTMQALADPHAVADDFSKPGHVVPLRAKDGGVLRRPGHTEAAVDLARLAGTTTRNVRVYRDRGLLHPPLRVGRIALYNDTHLTRLRLVTSMLNRGYNIAHVQEMLGAWEQGKDLGDVLGAGGQDVEPVALQLDLRERDLVRALAAQILVAQPAAAEVALGEALQPVRLVGFEHVAFEHRVVPVAAHGDAVVGEDVGVVLDVLADLGMLRTFQPIPPATRPARAECARARPS